ncbi:MAG: response regulator [Gammaproteobacteria bacterium]|jgi:CheY-like chemotaxis protein
MAENQSPGKILLVEDEEMAQFAAKDMLNQLGCDVDVAATGHEALEQLKRGFYDLVLMDLGIFDMDGFNITKKIRSMGDKLLKQIPIVIVTAYDHASIKKRASTLGLDDVLTKPLTLDGCKAVLNKYIRQKKTTE